VTALNALLKHGADPRIVDMEGSPPIFHAVMADNLPCVSALISSAAKLRTVNVFGGTVIHIACAGSDNPAMLKLLIEEGNIDINAIDYDGDTALNYAARAKFDNNARFLLDAGADPNIANVAGETAVHMAIYWNASGTLEELVARGIDFKHTNSRKATLLHAVAGHFDPQMLKILRRATSLKDVDRDVVDIDGYTCFDYLAVVGDEIGTAMRVTAFQEFLDEIGNYDESDSDSFEEAIEYI